LVAILAFAAYTGWRHVGVIDPRVWRSYLWVFPLLAACAVLAAFGIVVNWASQEANPGQDILELLLGLTATLSIAGVAVPGFVCVLLLRRMRIAPMGVRLGELLAGLGRHSGASGLAATKVERISLPRGLAYGAAGAAVLLGVIVAPLPTESEKALNVLRMTNQLTLLGFFLLVRARRYFQVSVDSLLAVDKRPPILFLRSFDDDERQKYADSRRALLDFSLETRLANHFHRFGPFIAIGSPKESVPQLGARGCCCPTTSGNRGCSAG
jgi:hypothetical protein